MNKKALMLTITLLAVAMLATPMVGTTQACRHRQRGFEKVPVSHTATRTSATPSTKNWTICDKFIIKYGATENRSVILNLPDESLVGTGYSDIKTIKNLETDVLIVFYDQVWTFLGGTFKGKIILEIRNHSGGPTAWDYTVVYCVLRGTGAFKRQTVILSYEGPFLFGAEEWTGFLFKR